MVAPPVVLTRSPGDVIRVEVDPNAFPYRIGVGDDVVVAWPEKYLDNRQRLHARAERKCPELPSGRYPLTVHDRNGRTEVGIVIVP